LDQYRAAASGFSAICFGSVPRAVASGFSRSANDGKTLSTGRGTDSIESEAMMKVIIPSPLLSYTNQNNEVEAKGATVADMLEDLNRQYPGIRFRMIDEQDAIRPHMKIFVNGEQVWRLDTTLAAKDEVHILQALSGG